MSEPGQSKETFIGTNINTKQTDSIWSGAERN